MPIEWELHESGPDDADHAVLLLPGGLNRARSYQELMDQPALKDVRMVAATLPGHGGTPRPDDLTIEHTAACAGDLAKQRGCDAVVGFSIGATVAFEMVTSGRFSGPVVLLGISLSLDDEARFLRVLDRLADAIGSMPFAAMRQMMGPLIKSSRVPSQRRAELLDDLRRNDPATMQEIIRCYLDYLRRESSPAERLCGTGVPTWVVHSEHGDGALTAHERQTLDACPTTHVETVPGRSFLLPNEEPERMADVLVAAIDHLC
jgi:pimeloyl-ACP methyl ester carboxylesterase